MSSDSIGGKDDREKETDKEKATTETRLLTRDIVLELLKAKNHTLPQDQIQSAMSRKWSTTKEATLSRRILDVLTVCQAAGVITETADGFKWTDNKEIDAPASKESKDAVRLVEQKQRNGVISALSYLSNPQAVGHNAGVRKKDILQKYHDDVLIVCRQKPEVNGDRVSFDMDPDVPPFFVLRGKVESDSTTEIAPTQLLRNWHKTTFYDNEPVAPPDKRSRVENEDND